MTHRSPFIKLLAEDSSIISLKTLCQVVEVGELLKKRQREADASLEKILG